MYKQDLTLDNLQRLRCRKTQPTNQPTDAKVCLSEDECTRNLIISMDVLISGFQHKY